MSGTKWVVIAAIACMFFHFKWKKYTERRKMANNKMCWTTPKNNPFFHGIWLHFLFGGTNLISFFGFIRSPYHTWRNWFFSAFVFTSRTYIAVYQIHHITFLSFKRESKANQQAMEKQHIRHAINKIAAQPVVIWVEEEGFNKTIKPESSLFSIAPLRFMC